LNFKSKSKIGCPLKFSIFTDGVLVAWQHQRSISGWPFEVKPVLALFQDNIEN